MKKIIPLIITSVLLAGNLFAQKINAKITDSVNITCMGDSNGSAAVEGIGGYTPYTYLWEPGGQTTDTATGLAAGTYTATVIDTASDTAEAIATIGTAAPPIVVATSSSEPSCFGMSNGAVAVTFITGGTAPFLIEWLPIMNNNDTVTGLPASTYTAQVTDANGCQVQNPVPVSQPTPLVLTSTIIANAVQALTSGGTPPYTYKWYPPVSTSSSVTGLSAGTYTITVRDSNNCFDSTAVIVPSVISLPSLTIYLPWQGQGSITCWAPSYFYFPIMAEADSTERFNNCVVDIKISGLFWGDDSANGGIAVTQGGQFQPGTGNDYNILNVTNLSDSIIQIEFGSPADTSPNGTIIPTYNPYLPNDTLLNVRLEMQTCGITPLVTFADTAAVSSLSNYTVPAGTAFNYPDSALQFVCTCGHYACWNSTSSADSTCCCTDSFNYRHFDTVGYTTITQTIPYYNTTYIGSVDEPPLVRCWLSILDFNDSVKAGIGDTLTITGTSFGSTRGTGQVEFMDADTSNYYLQKMDNTDYISWTNNQIKIRLPGFIDSVHTTLTSPFTVGGGPFIVTNSCGESATSGNNSRGNPFSIFYNIKQLWNPSDTPSQKTEIFLRRTDDSGGYTIRFDSITFPKGSIQRKIYTRAMNDWKCYVGMNWRVGKDTSFVYNALSPPPYINYVFMTSSHTLVDTNDLGVTNPRDGTCDDSINALLYASVYFNSNAKWMYDTTGKIPVGADTADFYGTCLHEQGHFIGLNHTTGRWDLMYYAANNGYIDTAHRLTLAKVFASGAVAGGYYSVHHSASKTEICDFGAIQPSKDAYCVNPFSGVQPISTDEKNSPTFVVYPNPSNGTFTIAANINDYTLVVMNMLGQQILSQKVHDEKTVINLSTVANGMYFIQEQYKNGIATQKLIIAKK